MLRSVLCNTASVSFQGTLKMPLLIIGMFIVVFPLCVSTFSMVFNCSVRSAMLCLVYSTICDGEFSKLLVKRQAMYTLDWASAGTTKHFPRRVFPCW